jgi:hypothetical protein
MVLKFVSNLPFADPLNDAEDRPFSRGHDQPVSVAQEFTCGDSSSGGTIVFFAFSLVSVVVLTEHVGHLPPRPSRPVEPEHHRLGSLLLRRPFTIDYAKLHVPQEL